MAEPAKNLMNLALEALFPQASRVVLGLVGLAGLFAGGFWYSPVSPAAVQHAGLFASSPTTRVAWLEQVADQNRDREVVAEALFQAAVIDEVELADPERAVAHLQQLTVLGRNTARIADAWDRLARLELRVRGDATGASRSFHKAWRLDPEAPLAASRLEASARAALDGGEHNRAHALFDKLAERYPERTAVALLGQAEGLLARGAAHEALMLFDKVEAAHPSSEEATVARLGASTCLDRLGDLDQAIAAVDAAEELPETVRDARRSALWERQRLAP